MSDETGILQHASFAIPRREDGYCLDDNARALLVAVLIEEEGDDAHDAVAPLAERYLAFVRHAWNGDSGHFHNFMSYERIWEVEPGSEDSHGRAVWALGTVLGRSRDPSFQGVSAPLFHEALRHVPAMTSPRAWAFTMLGIEEYLCSTHGDQSVLALSELLAERLLELFRSQSGTDWPWFEDRLTYCGARLSQALLLAGARSARADMRAVGLRTLDWLVSVQRSAEGYFAPIGSNGFYVRGRTRARFDQQPVEAAAMVSACLAAERVTGLESWAERARESFDWFLGHNELGHSIYDERTGGCRDGLHEDRVNENQGAESTLCFQLALLELRSRDAAVDRKDASRILVRSTPRTAGLLEVRQDQSVSVAGWGARA